MKAWPLIFLLPSLAFSFSQEKATVKIKSVASQGIREYRGSGFLFQNANKVYCLTSDHVLWHSNTGFVHWIENENFSGISASYLLSDWGRGLALLAVPNLSPSPDYPKLEELEPDPKVEGRVRVHGFPFASDELRTAGGLVVDPAKKLGLFFQQESLILLGASYGEYGMSGGPVFSKDTGHYLGLLSHQSLLPGTDPATDLLLIPGSTVVAWLKSYLSGDNFVPVYFAQNTGTQETVKPFIQTRHLELDLGTYMGSGIQAVIFNNHDPITPLYFPSTTNFFEGVADVLKSHPKDTILTYVTAFREKRFLGDPRYTFKTYFEFLKLLQDPTLQPMVYFSWDNPGEDKCLELRQKLYDQRDEFPSCHLTPFRSVCSGLTEISDRFDGEIGLVTPTDVEDLLGNKTAWDEGIKAFGEEKVRALRTLLEQHRDCLKNVTL